MRPEALSAICRLLLSAIKLQPMSKRTLSLILSLRLTAGSCYCSSSSSSVCVAVAVCVGCTPLICEARAEAQGEPLIGVDIKQLHLGNRDAALAPADLSQIVLRPSLSPTLPLPVLLCLSWKAANNQLCSLDSAALIPSQCTVGTLLIKMKTIL